MTLFVNAFDALWDAHTTAQTSIRTGTRVIAKALCTGIDLTREATEQGLFNQANVTVRIKASDEDKVNPLTIDKVIEVNHLATGQWVKLRIAARRDSAGLVILGLETPYE